MKLSIITCTYNSEKYLQETINSVINQKLDNKLFEHIFIDGNSKDNTIKIIEKYQKENPNYKIQLINKKPKGIYNAMNEGIKIAKGEYLLFLHSDDYLEPNILNDYINFIEKTGNVDLYYAKFNAVDFKGKFIYNAPNRKIYQNGLKKWLFGMICYINQPTVLHKRDLHEKYGYFNENLKIISDREFLIKLSKNKIKGIFYNKTITNFRVHNEGTSNNPKLNNIRKSEIEYIFNKYYGIEKYFYKVIVLIFSYFKGN